MHYTLFLFLASISGPPFFDGALFGSKATCEEAVKGVEKNVKDYNENTENTDKIVLYAVTCVPVKDAPQGDKL